MNAAPELLNRLAAAGQSHLVDFLPELSDSEAQELLSQLEALDFTELTSLARDYVLQRPETLIPENIAPAPYFPRVPRDDAELQRYQKAEALGAELIASGAVAFLTVAGGQGTRLGYNAPKGTYPIGPVTGRSLFAYFGEGIRRLGERCGRKLTWYVMTSTLNRAATEEFFHDHGFFGLEPDQVFFFTQGTMPAFGRDGKLLLAGKSSLALSPNGHGGTLLALRKSGALEKMEKEGTRIISYFQVDNPLAPFADPLFLGLHELEKAEMSAIMLPKTGPFEKLGNFCSCDGRISIIEYSDLPAELAESRNEDGSLRFISGSPAIHLISRDFVSRLTADGTLRLPWHRADKKIPFIDRSGNRVEPTEPNGVKLESFIFDALPLAERVVVLEGVREEMFAPTKNAVGVDSVESCRAMLTARDARRLRDAGAAVAMHADGTPAVRLELSPGVIFDDADAVEYVSRCAEKCGRLRVIAGGTLVVE